MKYEVINISTTTETYIANGILTHNKSDIPAYTDISLPLSIAFGANYTPQYPYSLTFEALYDNSSAPLKSAAILESSPITVNNSSQLNQTITLRIYKPSQAGRMPYTASAKGEDNLGVYNSGSSAFQYGSTGLYKGVSLHCLTPETLITKYDNNEVYLKDIKVGDELLTIDLKNMSYAKSIVTSKRNFFENELYIINDSLLKSSNSHNHIVKNDIDWIVKKSYELTVGDIVLNKNLEEIVINKIEILT